MFTTLNISRYLATMVFLLLTISCPVWAQKSLDGDQPASAGKSAKSKPAENSKPTASKTKDAGGKDLDSLPVENKPPGSKSTPAANTAKRPTSPDKPKDKPKVAKSSEKPPLTEESPTTADAPPVTTNLPSLPEMVSIPGGQFLMGSDAGLEYETPAHLVTLSSFELSKHEITNHQFQIFITETGYQTEAESNHHKFTWKSYAIKGREAYPVVMVTWRDAMEYCQWLSKKQAATYRLPTEAEWEYAARGGDKRQSYPWGEQLAEAQANFAPDSNRASYAEPNLQFIKPVGTLLPNAFGVYDIIGNVFEWTADWFGEKYYQASPTSNPTGPDSGKSRVIRGGSWAHQSRYCTVSYRKPSVPDFPASYIGFRVARVLAESFQH